jgi:hypothetical protein
MLGGEKFPEISEFKKWCGISNEEKITGHSFNQGLTLYQLYGITEESVVRKFSLAYPLHPSFPPSLLPSFPPSLLPSLNQA